MKNTETKLYRIHMKTEYFKIENDSLVIRVPAGVEINEEILSFPIYMEKYFIVTQKKIVDSKTHFITMCL